MNLKKKIKKKTNLEAEKYSNNYLWKFTYFI